MKHINILSLTQAHNSLTPELFEMLLSFHEISIKPAEIQDLKKLINNIYNLSGSLESFDAFYVGYRIPQIGKEFDLLRFGDSSIINIELKRSCSEEKVKAQLLRNKYYLSFIGRQIHCATFVSDAEVLYYLNEQGTLIRASFSDLKSALDSQQISRNEKIDDLFNPSDYLVSPFNSTQKFVNSEYFLTHQQEEIRNKVLQIMSGPQKNRFISITGSAGTGKTLLSYDISKNLTNTFANILIIHCGQLNAGQFELIRSGWNIIPIKLYRTYDLTQYDVIVLDETQRIYLGQLRDIIAKVSAANGSIIFSYDKLQTLSDQEERNNIDAEINNIPNLITHMLSEKIRTNRELASFLKGLFNRARNVPLSRSENIIVNYFDNLDDAKRYLSALDQCGWEVLRFTPSQYDNEHHESYLPVTKQTSHQVIGQEFECVAIAIDQNFSYTANGDLYYKGKTYYNVTKMLFQNITRARKRLNVVIINNKEVLSRCLAILS